MFDFLTNAKVNKVNDNYYTVTGSTKRFGKNQVMYEGIRESECVDYIQRYNTIKIPDPLIRNVMYEITRDQQGHCYLTTIDNGERTPKKRMKKSEIISFIKSRYNE